jgi:hypothetical protein
VSITTPSMGLKRWDQPNDVFSYTELSDNFNLLDAHDHSSGKGVQVPTGGIANLAITDTKLANNAVTSAKIATDAVTADKIPSASVTDAELTSPNSGVWRTLTYGQIMMIATTWVPAPYYLLGGPGTSPTSGVGSTTLPLIFPWNSSHYAVNGKTTALRLIVTGATNATASGSTFTFNLYPVSSVAGTAGVLSITNGASASPNVAFTTPAASTVHGPTASAEFLPANGTYLIGVTISQTMAANSVAAWTAYLQLRHV